MTGKRVCEKHQQAYETACPWCEPAQSDVDLPFKPIGVPVVLDYGYSAINPESFRFWSADADHAQNRHAADIIADMNRMWGKLAEQEQDRSLPDYAGTLRADFIADAEKRIQEAEKRIAAQLLCEPLDDAGGVTDVMRGEPQEAEWTVATLGEALMRAAMTPDYRILLCADDCVPPSPWTASFRVEVDHGQKVVRLSGSFT